MRHMMDKTEADKLTSSVIDLKTPGEPQIDSTDNIKQKSPTKRKGRIRDEKICSVCGDKALGYNFNAMTCESCKAFFRRNALKESSTKCLFQGDCQIDLRTRRFCPHCRLNKCFLAGMKKEMILDDSERKMRMQKVMDNRKKRKSDPSHTIVKEEPLSDSEMLPDQSHYSHSTDDSLSASSGNIAEMLKQKDKSSSILSPLPSKKEDDKTDNKYRELRPEEQAIYTSISEQYSSTLGQLVSGRSTSEDQYNNCTDLINQSEIAVRRLIKFVKRLEDFQLLSVADQIVALKACAFNSILIRSAWFYSMERNAWTTPSGEISTNILKNATGYGPIHEVHTKFCRRLKELIGNNFYIFALVQVICVFNPDNKDLEDNRLMSDLQDKYLILLKHYLEAEYSFSNSQTIFSKLIAILTDMKEIHIAHSAILLQANMSEIEPLMLEVLDLK